MKKVLTFILAIASLSLFSTGLNVAQMNILQAAKKHSVKKLDSATVNKKFSSAIDSLKAENEKTILIGDELKDIAATSKENTEKLIKGGKEHKKLEYLARKVLKIQEAKEEELPQVMVILGQKRATEIPVAIKPLTERDSLIIPETKRTFFDKIFHPFRK